jgi:hypothetical protein
MPRAKSKVKLDLDVEPAFNVRSTEGERFDRAAIAAMSGILANPVAWAELKTEAAINKTPVLDGLAQASCNAAEALVREINARTRAVMPAIGNPTRGVSEVDNG